MMVINVLGLYYRLCIYILVAHNIMSVGCQSAMTGATFSIKRLKIWSYFYTSPWRYNTQKNYICDYLDSVFY